LPLRNHVQPLGGESFSDSYLSLQQQTGAIKVSSTTNDNHRWATRKEAMAYARLGATTVHHLMRTGRILAKKLSPKKVLIDLNSIDAFYESLPTVGAVR
jgi:hypothetical protein